MTEQPDFSRLTDAQLRQAYARQERWLTETMEDELKRCFYMQELSAEGQRRGINVWEAK